jgi:hypothetical protein
MMTENIKPPLAPHKYPELARSRGPRQLPKAATAPAKPGVLPAATSSMPAEPEKPATERR